MSIHTLADTFPARLVCLPRIVVTPLALGVAPPSLSGAPEPDGWAGEERKKSGDCVEVVVCKRDVLGVACDACCEAREASEWSCSSGPAGPGLEEGTAEFRVLRRGVTEAEVRCERRLAGDDMTEPKLPI